MLLCKTPQLYLSFTGNLDIEIDPMKVFLLQMVYKMCHYKSRDRVIVDLSGAGVFYSRYSVKHRKAMDRKGGWRGALATDVCPLTVTNCLPLKS